MDEKLIAEMHIEYMRFGIKNLNELGWKIQFDTLEYGKQDLDINELEIDYKNKKIIF